MMPHLKPVGHLAKPRFKGLISPFRTWEFSWSAPVHKLDGALGFDGRNGGIDVLGNDVSAVHHAAGLIFWAGDLLLRAR